MAGFLMNRLGRIAAPLAAIILMGASGGPNGVPPLHIGSSTGNSLQAPSSFFVCTATCTVTPPLPQPGWQFCVWNDDNVAGVITLGALGGSARYENTARTAYGTAGTGTLASAGAAGDLVCIVGRDTTHYFTVTFKGTWTVN